MNLPVEGSSDPEAQIRASSQIENASDRAINLPSLGGLLPKAIDTFLNHLCVVTTHFNEVAYGKWKEKKEICNKVAKKASSASTEKNLPVLEVFIETQLLHLSLNDVIEIQKLGEENSSIFRILGEKALHEPKKVSLLLQKLLNKEKL